MSRPHPARQDVRPFFGDGRPTHGSMTTDECREAKRRCCQLERAASRSPLQTVDPVNSVRDLGCTWTPICRWTRTLPNLSVPVSASCDRYPAYVARYHVHHWQH